MSVSLACCLKVSSGSCSWGLKLCLTYPLLWLSVAKHSASHSHGVPLTCLKTPSQTPGLGAQGTLLCTGGSARLSWESSHCCELLMFLKASIYYYYFFFYQGNLLGTAFTLRHQFWLSQVSVTLFVYKWQSGKWQPVQNGRCHTVRR